MSRSHYKRLGDYIREVNVRNRKLAVTKLVGLSISKCFIPSIANIIGTDMSTYRIIKPTQFAFCPVTSRNGDKITIAHYKEEGNAIVSQAYTVFEVIDREELVPEYLMMWFRRVEFDRYARFRSHGSAREIFDWDELCDVTLPIPAIDVQREIVSEYEALSRRIAINESICEKLEATAQTLYRKIFVDNIDPENLPEGWRMGTLSDVASFCYGKLPNRMKSGNIPIYSGYGITGYTDEYTFDTQHIVVVARGDAGSGNICMSPVRFFLTNLAIAVLLNDEQIKYFLYFYLLYSDTTVLRSGSAQAQVTITSLEPFEILIPEQDICYRFGEVVSLIYNTVDLKKLEIESIKNAKLVQLSKLSTN